MRALLRGQFFPGMFPNERFLEISDSGGHRLTFIVAASAMTERGTEKLMEVQVLDECDGASVIHVPGEGLQSTSLITVRDSDLVKESA